ncbi:thioesterase II family protein [Streptomyces sp. NBC_00576]|uniref:thioesterase II family protein n=1 Tax=Streptomyces sp. NBC_00576 TaxID=2903665 RepID=UPI002E81E93A|nr:alpha/beta fold hydrolase [Streptomyces sp. NBC_00576]WUB68675.1 alpha/beta fold hydrolase [Streptomyces sp. NBC_00576]WUB77022.1 alpha/beta fold hydrolase [Streptomyces sp. NBC_00576]
MRRTSLLCVPFAGAGASFFHPWAALTDGDPRIVALQLPGREWRLSEDSYRDVAQAVAGLFPAVTEEIGSGDRVAIFGHSLGAVLAYELAHLLVARTGADVARLFVSGSPGPWTRRTRRATGLPDEEFLLRVKEFAGYDHEALSDPGMRELILPTLRADVEMHENYVPATDQPLPVPVTAVRGTEDDLVTADQTAEWGKATSAEFTQAEVEGGHMYIAEDPGSLLRLVDDALAR